MFLGAISRRRRFDSGDSSVLFASKYLTSRTGDCSLGFFCLYIASKRFGSCRIKRSSSLVEELGDFADVVSGEAADVDAVELSEATFGRGRGLGRGRADMTN